MYNLPHTPAETPAGKQLITFFRVIPKPGTPLAAAPCALIKGAKPFALGYSDADSFYFAYTDSLAAIDAWAMDHDPWYMAYYHGVGFRGLLRPEWKSRAPSLYRWCDRLSMRPWRWFNAGRLVYLSEPYPHLDWLNYQFPAPEQLADLRRERWRVMYWRDHEGFKERRRVRDQIREVERQFKQDQLAQMGAESASNWSERRQAAHEKAAKEAEIVYTDDFIGPCTRARLKKYNWLRTMVLKQDPIPVPD